MESDSVERICILSGIHMGAVITVGSRPILVGSGDDCDALLSDVSVKDAAVKIAVDQRGRLMASTVRGDVRRNGRILRPDSTSSFDNGTTISLGDVKIVGGHDMIGAQRSVDRRSKRRTLLSWGGACAASLALFGFFGAVGGPADAFNLGAQVPGRTAPMAELLRRAEDPMPELEREIALNDLSGLVSVEQTVSGQMLATGVVSAAELDRWNSTVRWFDGRFGDRAVLESRVSLGASGVVLPFEIVSIVASSNPRVVIQNGDSFPVGSFLPGGWELRRIANTTVVLVREGRELAITF